LEPFLKEQPEDYNLLYDVALRQLLSIPYEGSLGGGQAPLTPALLRLDPMFDPLRNDPRFQKLIAAPTPNNTKR
jgi:hypothetical protein